MKPLFNEIGRQIMQELIETSLSGIENKQNDLIIEGLKRKGFDFSNHFELIDFIKENCTATNNQDLKITTYFVNGIPFLAYFDKREFSERNLLGVNYNIGEIISNYQFL